MPEQSNTSETYHFTFKVNNPVLAPLTNLRLFNGYNDIVKEGYGDMVVDLPRGVYQLRIAFNEYVENRHYRVTHSIEDSISDIKTSSSIPIEGLSTTRNFFSAPSSKWSRQSTSTEAPINTHSIFLFLRYADENRSYESIPNLEKGFLLLNQNREVLFTIDNTNTKTIHGRQQEYYSAVSFNEMVEPGQYYLVYIGNTTQREIPLFVFEGWQTQVFIMFKEAPVFSSLRISIERDGFSQQNAQTLQLDALIQKMYNGIYYLPSGLTELAAAGKWQNLMLGILAAYLYLLSYTGKDDALFKTILHNLEKNILHATNAPDLIALRLLGALHFGQPVPEEPLRAPCMVAVGMQAFLKQSFSNEAFVPSGSLVEKIYPFLHGDNIWTTYNPLPIKKATQVLKKQLFTRELFSVVKSSTGAILFNPEKDWLIATVFNQLQRAETKSDIFSLAAELQVPPNVIRKTLVNMNTGDNLNAIAMVMLEAEHSAELKDTINRISVQINKMLE